MMVFRRLSMLVLPLTALTLTSLTAAVAAHPDEDATGSSSAELAKIDSDGYSILVNDGSAKVGEQGFIVVTLTAKDGFKVNEQYPHKVALDNAPEGLEYPKPVLKKGDAELGKTSLTFRIPVKAKKAGSFDVKGNLKISVCNAESCLIKKEALAAKLTAK